ncbi:MAG: hypothetical protein EP298_06810 [Gammaproteobacteria bacterium]|nr:MAG: hypothetical protein EP298_06810 [Gammaproteobacteria bacterium]UTW42944.1 hypothetical protein KFE69_02045 [bacterium SCSIO 12844]
MNSQKVEQMNIYTKSCFLFVICLLLASCATKIPYSPKQLNENEALFTIERAFLEQPEKFRPRSILITNKYIALSDGVISKTSGKSGSTIIYSSALTTSKSTTQAYKHESRIYYASIDKIELYSKKNYYIVVLKRNTGHTIKKVYIYNKNLAEKFIDSITYFKNNYNHSS